MKLFDRQKYDPLTASVSGADPVASATEIKAVITDGTALENQLPPLPPPRQKTFLKGAVTLTFPAPTK
ncbi:MAG: hypothetical protein AAB574_00140 [Patescibacteria group bacterium]